MPMLHNALTEGRAWDIYSDAHPVDAIRAAFDAGRKYERAATKENLARLRNTPVGRALMAEGWGEGMLDHMGRRRGIMSSEMVSIIRERIADTNPYRGGDGTAS